MTARDRTAAAALLAAALCLFPLTSCRAPAPAPRAASLPPVFPDFVLIPQPKSVRLTGSALRLNNGVRLTVAPGASSLDRLAMLSVGLELRRLGQPPPAKNGGGVEIVLGEPARMPRVARLLAAAGAMPCAHAEGYVLLVEAGRIVVAGHDPHGTFYGAQTLCQMLGRDAHGVSARAGRVDDYPSLPWRGVHLFVGSHALPFHEKLVSRVLARLKMNHLVLQCEQARWDNLGKAAPPWAMSKRDLRTDIAYARRYGLTVTPLVNSAGHLPWLFKDPQNLPLAEDPDTPYAANVSNPATYVKLFALYDEVLDTFGSDTLGVGGDEITLRGRFPYRSKRKYPTVAAAYTAHVTRLHDHLKARGVRTLLWADMLLAPGDALDATNAPSRAQAAEMRAALPKDIELADWHYRTSDPFTSPLILRRAGFGPTLGGTWAVPGNIVSFSRALTAQGQRGLLQTTWAGYNSSEANLKHEKAQFAAFVLAADCAWNGGTLDPKRLPYDPSAVFDRLYQQAN